MSFALSVPVDFRLCRELDLPALEWMGLHTREREIIAETFAAQQRGEALMLLAEANGYPIGQAWLDFVARGTAACPRLWAVRVFPPLQGCGLGGRIMAEAEALAFWRGARDAELTVERDNVGALRFYRRLGYRAVGEEPGEIRRDAAGHAIVTTADQLIMRKRLVSAVAAFGSGAVSHRSATGAP